MATNRRKLSRERALIRRGRNASKLEAEAAARALQVTAAQAELKDLTEALSASESHRAALEGKLGQAQTQSERDRQTIEGLRQLLRERDSAMENMAHELSQLQKQHKRLMSEDRSAAKLRRKVEALKDELNKTRAQRDKPCHSCRAIRPALA